MTDQIDAAADPQERQDGVTVEPEQSAAEPEGFAEPVEANQVTEVVSVEAASVEVDEPVVAVSEDLAPAGSDSVERASRSGKGGSCDVLDREGEIAADFLETLLDIADLDGDIDVDVEGDRAVVSIVDSEEGQVPRRLVGPSGKVLDALQELTRLAVQAETGNRSRLMLDIADYRAGKRRDLVELAKAAAGRVKESGEREELEPMSAFERKVVHDAVLAEGLSSESEGADPNRYVVVLPAS